jgi:hypothetical protein
VVLADRAIGREVTHARDIRERHACPSALVTVGFGHMALTIHARAVIGRHQEEVVVEQRIYERPEDLAIVAGEGAVASRVTRKLLPELVEETLVDLEDDLHSIAARWFDITRGDVRSLQNVMRQR